MRIADTISFGKHFTVVWTVWETFGLVSQDDVTN